MIDLEALLAEEQALLLPYFDLNVAWKIGEALRHRASEETLPIAIEVSACGSPVFVAVLPGATPDSLQWAKRKRNVVQRFHRSSLYYALQQEQQGRDFLERFSLKGKEYVAKGGAVPILVKSAGIVGVVAISGLPHLEDHELVIDILRGIIDTLTEPASS